MKKYKLVKYDTYKNTGHNDLKSVPSHWMEKRVKDIATLERGKFTHRPRNDPQMYDGDHPFIQTGDVARANKYVTSYKQTLSDKGIKVSKKFSEGTLVMAIAANIGDVAIVSFDTYFPDSLVGYAPKKSDNDYLFYLLSATKTELNRVKVTSTQDNLNLERLNSLVKFIPPLSEQKNIANYLDIKTEQIDYKIDLLTKKVTQYSKLKQSLINKVITRGLEKNVVLKDSGVEWIGEIPEYWDIKRLKEIGFLYNGLSGKKGEDFTDEHEYSSNFIPFVNIANNRYISPEDMKKVIIYPNEKQNKVRKYDLFFLMSSENHDDIGKSALLNVEIDNTYLNSFCRGFRITKKNIVPNFINYLLSSEIYRNSVSLEGKGFTRINLKIEKINDLLLLIPPYSEQKAIAHYLDAKIERINNINQVIYNQIDKLKELRKTLINDVVTGKIKVVVEEKEKQYERTSLAR